MISSKQVAEFFGWLFFFIATIVFCYCLINIVGDFRALPCAKEWAFVYLKISLLIFVEIILVFFAWGLLAMGKGNENE